MGSYLGKMVLQSVVSHRVVHKRRLRQGVELNVRGLDLPFDGSKLFGERDNHFILLQSCIRSDESGWWR